jgi:hypothetical protein
MARAVDLGPVLGELRGADIEVLGGGISQALNGRGISTAGESKWPPMPVSRIVEKLAGNVA